MKFLQSLSAQVSLFTQGAILALGVVFILLDVITESLNPVIDLAWVTVLVCGLPLLINSVQSIWERLEIHANFRHCSGHGGAHFQWRLSYGGLCGAHCTGWFLLGAAYYG